MKTRQSRHHHHHLRGLHLVLSDHSIRSNGLNGILKQLPSTWAHLNNIYRSSSTCTKSIRFIRFVWQERSMDTCAAVVVVVVYSIYNHHRDYTPRQRPKTQTQQIRPLGCVELCLIRIKIRFVFFLLLRKCTCECSVSGLRNGLAERADSRTDQIGCRLRRGTCLVACPMIFV